MNPWVADWWLKYGLDGIVSGLIGGAVTAGAVLLTLRHQRALSELEGARLVASRLHALCWRIGLLIRQGANIESIGPVLEEMIVLTFELNARAERRWPGFAAQVDETNGNLTDALDSKDPHPTPGQLALGFGTLLHCWMSDPRFVEKRRGARSFGALRAYLSRRA